MASFSSYESEKKSAPLVGGGKKKGRGILKVVASGEERRSLGKKEPIEVKKRDVNLFQIAMEKRGGGEDSQQPKYQSRRKTGGKGTSAPR